MFAQLTGGPILFPKRTWAGTRLRIQALAVEGIVIADDDPEAANIAADDVLDAAGAAWTTRRCIAGTAKSLPETQENQENDDSIGVAPAMFT